MLRRVFPAIAMVITIGLSGFVWAADLPSKPTQYCEKQSECEDSDWCYQGTCHDKFETRFQTLFPIAVDSILNQSTGIRNGPIGRRLTAWLRYYLNQSRFVWALPADRRPSTASLEGMAATTIDFQSWSDIGAYAVLKGEIRQSLNGSAQLQLRLYSTETWAVIKVASERQEFEATDEPALRKLAARWVNDLLIQLTGRSGSLLSSIVYTRGEMAFGPKDIHTVDLVGIETRQVTRNGRANLLPSWTRDGRVSYTTIGDRTTHLMIEGRPFSTFPRMNVGADFHPDGKRAALTLSKDGNTEIYVLDVKTGEIRKRLTHHRATDTSPVWSPDGGRLVFVSDRNTGAPQLWVMNEDGSGAAVLPQVGGYNTSPDWSPLGHQVAYCTMVDGGRFEIMILDMRTEKVRPLVRGHSNRSPSFSPDGRRLIFSSNRSGQYGLWMVDVDGGGLKQLPLGEGHFSSPSWSRISQ